MGMFPKDELYFLKASQSLIQHLLNFPLGEKLTLKAMENTFQEFTMWGGKTV